MGIILVLKVEFTFLMPALEFYPKIKSFHLLKYSHRLECGYDNQVEA